MEFSFDPPPGNDASTLASERLRKAIERNRAKQQKRTLPSEPYRATDNAGPRRSVATVQNVEFTTDLETIKSKPPVPIGYASAKRKVTTKKRSSRISVSQKPLDYFVKACWVFAFILFARLIFSSGGVVDYYSSKQKLADRAYEAEQIVKDNKAIALEIEAIRTDQAYQRKIVREHLGFISKDEFLILFHQEKAVTSI